jgi:hypothetical protein
LLLDYGGFDVFWEVTAALANINCAKRARLLYLQFMSSGMIDHFVARFVATVDPFSPDQPRNASFFVVHFMPWLVSQEYAGLFGAPAQY